MISRVYTCSILGIDALIVEVEVDLSPGLPYFATVGLPDSIVRESKDRVKTALQNSGYPFPSDRITVNLAPAHLKKEGAGFDLPIAIGILSAMGILETSQVQGAVLAGELSLDGRVKPIQGSLPMAVQARQSGYKTMILPAENAPEAAVVEGLCVRPVRHLSEVVDFLKGRLDIAPAHIDPQRLWTLDTQGELDFSEIRGQEHARRAMEVAAAGSHNALTLYGI